MKKKTVNPDCEPLLVDGRAFKVHGEAKAFIGLLFAGRMTYAQCREAILMTPAQLSWLIKNEMADHTDSGDGYDGTTTLKKLYRLRKRTWLEFRGMFNQAIQKAIAALTIVVDKDNLISLPDSQEVDMPLVSVQVETIA